MDSFSQFTQISQKLLKTYYLDNDDIKKIEHKFLKNTFQLKISSNSRPLESFQFKLCNLHDLQKLTLFQGNKYNNIKK